MEGGEAFYAAYAVLNIPEYGNPVKFASLPQREKAFVISCINIALEQRKNKRDELRR